MIFWEQSRPVARVSAATFCMRLLSICAPVQPTAKRKAEQNQRFLTILFTAAIPGHDAHTPDNYD